jgi:hypothetical protein
MGSAPKPPSLVTKAQYDKAIADYTAGYQPINNDLRGSGPEVKAEDIQTFKDSMSVLPPPTPDLADDAVQKARQAARRKILMGGMTGPLDLTSGGAKPLPGLGGV